ncbi:hypothetical protein [Aeromicrobium sp. Root472D3]|uniref:hypothetical protein n=1 Tax=Aeromicrobium sp. Root472D3 TaxID=1736540 RepID=UPI001910D2EE|nr:hypothetical protein [Aeromicrobium sp. Root472D3]
MEPQQRVGELQAAVERYSEGASPFYDEVVQEISKRAAEQGNLGKADIGALVAWKRLNANTRWMSDLMRSSDATVRAATAEARKSALQEGSTLELAAARARSALAPIPGFGVGDALASAVIYALAPGRMAVYDRRAQAGLELLGLELTAKSGRYGRYMALVDQLVNEARVEGLGLSAREIDLGLFTLGGPVA